MVKNKVKYKEDDGHTIYNMNVDGMKGYVDKSQTENFYTKKEKFAMIKAAYKVYFFPLLIIIIGFAIALILIYFLWLK